jgi:glycosyltransferase involved in cell wall biosynthesis
MKTLMLSWEYPPYVVGGMGRHVAELAPALAQRDITLHLVTPTTNPSDPPKSLENGITVHRVFAPALIGAHNVFDRAVLVNKTLEQYVMRESLQHGKCDLIHTHDWLTGFAALNLQQQWHCPLVSTIHATERGRYRGFIDTPLQQAIDQAEQTLARQSGRVIVCSHYMANEVQYFFQTPAEKLAVIPNGVDPDTLQVNLNPAELAAFRASYVAPDDLLVFSVSRLVYEKGVHLIVQAAPQVLQECPQARFVIAGKGPEADNIRRQAEHLDVVHRFNFIGFISDDERNAFLKVANCAIFPSLYEPFGIVALEAMAMGCPVIVSDIGGLAEVVTHAETGVKIYPDNVDSTAWGITHALNHPDWAKRHAEKALKTVKERFNWPRIAGLTMDTYQDLVRETR